MHFEPFQIQRPLEVYNDTVKFHLAQSTEHLATDIVVKRNDSVLYPVLLCSCHYEHKVTDYSL